LYRTQLANVGAYLRSIAVESPVSRLWELVHYYRAGAVQERWLAENIICKLWSAES